MEKIHFCATFCVQKNLSCADRERRHPSSREHAIIYLSNTELFAAEKFRSQNFFRGELNSNNNCLIRCEKVVAKSSLITIIALPRESDDCPKKRLKVIALFPMSFDRFFALIFYSHGPETHQTSFRFRQARMVCVTAAPGNLGELPD